MSRLQKAWRISETGKPSGDIRSGVEEWHLDWFIPNRRRFKSGPRSQKC